MCVFSIDKINYAGNSGYYLSFYEEFSTIENEKEKQFTKVSNIIGKKKEEQRRRQKENKRVKKRNQKKEKEFRTVVKMVYSRDTDWLLRCLSSRDSITTGRK